MRRLILSEFLSLDGVVQDPASWVFDHPDPQQNDYKLDEVLACDALLLGRRTYEEFAGAWPQRSGQFADQMNGMSKHVVSTTLSEASWSNSTVIDQDVPAAVEELKTWPGGDILLVGSAQLAQSLMPHNLIDEYRLFVFPVVLGGGKRLFSDASSATVLRLMSARTLASGTTILTYQP
jgi:dihydrofolate reductase